MIKVELTENNLLCAGLVGVCRQVSGFVRDVQAGRDTQKGKYGVNNAVNGWQYNCDGAMAEMAVAKHFGVFYDGAYGNFKAKDVGELQVRSTSLKRGSLLLHDSDLDDDRFILVLTFEAPVLYLCGWCYGREGKQEQYWRTDTKRPAYFYPQNFLRSMDTISQSEG